MTREMKMDATDELIQRLTAERDAAIAERDMHKAYSDLLDKCYESLISKTRTITRERDKLRARVAESGSFKVRTNEDGSLDEVVGVGRFHLEQMGDAHWWMQIGDCHIDLVAKGKIKATHWVDKPAALGASHE